MSRPTKDELAALVEPLADALAVLASSVTPDQREAWTTIVNYIAVTQRVLAKTNPSKIRDAARTVEIQTLMPAGMRVSLRSVVARQPHPGRRKDD